MDKTKIILDTDIGDDIDDALALALLLKMPQVEILGVTTVFLDTDRRARIARKLIRLFGKDIPVYAGLRLGEGMHHNIDAVCCQYTPDIEAPCYAPENDMRADNGEAAVEFILDAARKYGKDLTLIAIGPLTNVGRAFCREPELMKQVRVVIMGGCFYRQFSEWNIVCDPRAAKAVIHAGGNLTCVGIEVTEQTTLNDAQQQIVMHNEQDEGMRYLSELVRMHHNYTGRNSCLHDVLAAYYVLYPQVLTTEEIVVRVETEGEYTAGMTINMYEMFHYLTEKYPGETVTVAKTVDLDAFFRGFFDLVYPNK